MDFSVDETQGYVNDLASKEICNVCLIQGIF